MKYVLHVLKTWFPRVLSVGLLVGPTIANAQIIDRGALPNVATAGNFKTVPAIIQSGFNIIITVSGIVFVVLFLIGGVMYLTSLGNEEQVKKARTLMLDAVIGIVIIVVSWSVGNYVLKLLGISPTFN